MPCGIDIDTQLKVGRAIAKNEEEVAMEMMSQIRDRSRSICTLEDWVYSLTRPVKSLRVEINDGQRRWQPRSAAMAAGLTDHFWTIEELMMKAVVPKRNNTK